MAMGFKTEIHGMSYNFCEDLVSHFSTKNSSNTNTNEIEIQILSRVIEKIPQVMHEKGLFYRNLEHIRGACKDIPT